MDWRDAGSDIASINSIGMPNSRRGRGRRIRNTV